MFQINEENLVSTNTRIQIWEDSLMMINDSPFIGYGIETLPIVFHKYANLLKNRLIDDYNITGIKIEKISNNSYRVYKGPFKKFGRTLIKNQKGNIILHKEVPTFSEASDIFD